MPAFLVAFCLRGMIVVAHQEPGRPEKGVSRAPDVIWKSITIIQQKLYGVKLPTLRDRTEANAPAITGAFRKMEQS